MRPRVCIFAAETLLHWSGYYVRAFRQHADVIVIGPQFDPEGYDYPDWDQVKANLVTNDIYSTSESAEDRLALLPEGWTPSVVVRIQSGDCAIHGVGRVGCPTVYLTVDTWHSPTDYSLAHQYDFVFIAQKALMKYMRQMGCCRVFWLPLGYDPASHFPVSAAETVFDIGFVGSTHFAVNRQRRQRLQVLKDHFQVGDFFGLGPEDVAQVYSRSTLVFNASIACDVNMRVFEVLAAGRPLVTNREAAANGLFELFEDGVHLISYDDEDMVGQVRRYLNDPSAAQAIGEQGREAVVVGHTYGHRVLQIFEILREHHVDLDRTDYPLLLTGTQLRDFIPIGTMRLLDVGLGIGASRIALRRHGVDYVAGIATDGLAMRQREKSYDVIWSMEELPSPSGDFDTVVCTARGKSAQPVDSLLEFARAWLVQGGRLLLGVAEADLTELAGGLSFQNVAQCFAVRHWQLLVWCRPAEQIPFHLILVTPVDATLGEVNYAMYGEFPVNGTVTDPWNGVTDEEGPGSPDVVDP